ncbi:hypothetical protein K493DRAFT_367022 [Basidiobolus meristosporus CBS 931.73]|uniref:DUF3626 domain-containing protein n=1 Tax=Basidiobolus meristosporus CBS 931.73 TaxID=1314790 RepID=A0A1Y1YKZ4_9FUNG|nr:hypothetical protein K493DRAFT_367022 [Basidiobolus meristosporus CBS 931.73]|eukprot:ORX98658.1 hypothetical protein K493DRAFT_367022 [Basidiobolus meristosporus CBS 931.73]
MTCKDSLQKQAIEYVTSKAQSGLPMDRNLRITAHFHPDTLYEGRLLIEELADSGEYRSQFETGTSNGGLTATVGGERWQWESRIFGGVYDSAPASERPKYGSLNFRKRDLGGSPRFGSAFFRLKEETLDRATFCYPDSYFCPEHFSVAQSMYLIDVANADQKDILDDYIETQIHGTLSIAKDVEALVLDPCYKNSRVEEAANRLPCKIEWHSGFVLSSQVMEEQWDYRGEEYVRLGLTLMKDGILTAKEIGDAAATGKYSQQDLKKVWHYVARWGGNYSSDWDIQA